MTWIYVLTYKWTLTIKYRISTLYSIDPKKLDKKESPNEHGWISFKEGTKTVRGGRWKRENWMGEWISKGKGEWPGTGVVRDKRWSEGQEYEWNSAAWGGGVWKGGESLGCARDQEWEVTKDNMGVILVEMHGRELWKLKRPYLATRKDLLWRIKHSKWTKYICSQNWSCLQEMQAQRWSRDWGNGQIIPYQLETHPMGKHQSWH